MDNNIKYLIEDIIKFDISVYQDDNSDLIDTNTLSSVLTIPKTQDELIDLILKRMDENKFGYKDSNNRDICFPDLSDIDVSLITNMSFLFKNVMYLFGYRYNELIKLDLSNWNVSDVTDMSYMFRDFKTLIELNVSGWDVSNVTNMEGMFYECSSLIELDLSNFNTLRLKNMKEMFCDCYSLEKLNLFNFNTSNVITMRGTFCLCESLKKLDLRDFDTSNVINMAQMFNQCKSLVELNVSSFNTVKVQLMYSIFVDCTSLEKLDLSNFDTSNVTDMDYMFSGCKLLKELDISNFVISKDTNINYMFTDCLQLKPNIKVKKLDKCIDDMLTESLQKFNPADYYEDDDIINNQDIEKLVNPINDFLSFLSKYSWSEQPIGQLEMRRNSGRNNSNKLFFVWKDIYTQINNLMEIYSDVYDSKVSNKDIAYVYIKPMDDTYQYGMKTTYVIIIDKNNPNNLNAIFFQYVDWGPQHIIGLSYKNKYDIKEYPYLNPNTEYNGILPVEIITKIKQKFNLQGMLKEKLYNFNPADYSDEEGDIIDNETINDLTDPINDFTLLLDKFEWERNKNHISVSIEDNQEASTAFNKILNGLETLMESFKKAKEPGDDSAIIKIYRHQNLYILTILYKDEYINFSWRGKMGYLDTEVNVISILIPKNNKYFANEGHYIGEIYPRLISKLKNKYHITNEV